MAVSTRLLLLNAASRADVLPPRLYAGTTEATISDEELVGVQVDIKESIARYVADDLALVNPSKALRGALDAIDHVLSCLEFHNDELNAHRLAAFGHQGPDTQHQYHEDESSPWTEIILNRNDRRRALGISAPVIKLEHLSSSAEVLDQYSTDPGLECDHIADEEVDADDTWYLDEGAPMAMDADEDTAIFQATKSSSTAGSDFTPVTPEHEPTLDEPMVYDHQEYRPSIRARDQPVVPHRPTPPPQIVLSRPTVSAGITDFLRLRAPYLDPPPSPSVHVSPIKVAPNTKQPVASIHETVPDTLLDADTLSLPVSQCPPQTTHTYLASLRLIQRSALVQTCTGPHARIMFVEREDLGDADVLLDPHTAVLLVPISSLPTEHAELAERVADLAPRFSRILLLFECYPQSAAYKRICTSDTPLSPVFSPPTIKAVQALRRTLAIMGSCDSRLEHTTLLSAFALSVSDAAQLLRLAGDSAERADTTAVLFGKTADGCTLKSSRRYGAGSYHERAVSLMFVCHAGGLARYSPGHECVCGGRCPRWRFSKLLSGRNVARRAKESFRPLHRRFTHCSHLLLIACMPYN
jgi:hypothetical protein